MSKFLGLETCQVTTSRLLLVLLEKVVVVDKVSVSLSVLYYISYSNL